jgi:long-chain acyl-CoA synthetase
MRRAPRRAQGHLMYTETQDDRALGTRTKPRTLCEAFQRTASVDPDAIALRTPGGAVEITWREHAQRVRRIAEGLAALGVRRGDTVALMMTNRPEFNLCDTAAIHLGATPFSVYNTSPANQITHLFENADNRVVICEATFLDQVTAAGGKVEHIVCVDRDAPGTIALSDLEQRRDDTFDFDASWRAVGPEDVLTLIYTSGTTGPPKGVEMTHANMLAEIEAMTAVLPVASTDRVVSYLPSAHAADRVLTHYLQMTLGPQITCIADLSQLVPSLSDIRPTIWAAVPRVWEKLETALESRIDAEPDAGLRQNLLRAIATGRRKVRAEQAAINGTGPGPDDELLADYRKADAHFLSAIRRQVGLDEVRWSMSGAAPISIDVLEFFGAIGLPICEALGVSELSGLVTVNSPDRTKLGTVGPALPGVELMCADDGELLCRGPLVMRGYRKEPEKTAEAIDAAGWLHTGDVAEIDDDGYVRIVDRKKELIINAAGKNMSPAAIESALKSSSRLIGQAVAIGDRRPYNVALIVLDPEVAASFADDTARAAEVDRAIDAANTCLSRVEQVKRYAVLDGEWLAGGDELTPTMKLKRKPIVHKYAAEIEALYAGSD